MPWPDGFLQELKDRNDIVSVVSEYVSLKGTGHDRVGLCPFHSEKTGSFHVNSQKQSYKCFGCGEYGDVIAFITKMRNVEFLDAVSILCERCGMTMPQKGGDTEKSRRERDLERRIYEANEAALNFFFSNLLVDRGRPGLEYLRLKRQLSKDIIKKFGLGYAVDNWTALTDALLSMGFTEEELLAANLSIRTQKGNLIDRYRNRVIFPIISTTGKVVGFGGRTLGTDKAKYINTSDTPVFKKSRNLYALNLAKNTKEDYFILCEGYMDAIALWQAGFDNVVAGLGTALTEEQAKLIKNKHKRVVLCYDSDEPGQKAALAAMKIFDRIGVETLLIRVPDGKDPDEFLKNHGESGYVKFKQLVIRAVSDVDFYYEKLRQKVDDSTTEGQNSIIEEMTQFLSELSSEVRAALYANKLASDYNIGVELINGKIAEKRRKRLETNAKKENVSAKRTEHREELPVFDDLPGELDPGEPTDYDEPPPEYYFSQYEPPAPESDVYDYPDQNVEQLLSEKKIFNNLQLVIGCLLTNPQLADECRVALEDAEFYRSDSYNHDSFEWRVINDIIERSAGADRFTESNIPDNYSLAERERLRDIIYRLYYPAINSRNPALFLDERLSSVIFDSNRLADDKALNQMSDEEIREFLMRKATQGNAHK